MTKKIKQIAYKGFNVNSNNQLQCRNTIFCVGEIYTISGELRMCNNGFHYCRQLNDIDKHYNLRSSVIGEIEVLGQVLHDTDGKKSCTNKFKIIRILTKEQVWAISNTGKDNTGFINSGNYNSGDRNSGNYNSGYYNSGDYNSGDRNSGDYNSGYYNSGYYNSGNYNSGNYNSGNYNSGNRNSGYYNSGNRNSGDYNSGYYNSGYYNSGDRNSGDYNSGYYNSGDYSNGFFNTKEHIVFMFDKTTKMTTSEFKNSKYSNALTSERLVLIEWINYTEEEKSQDKAKKLIEGYLKKYEYKEACQTWWNKLTKENRTIIQSIPNFDKDIFFEITGITL